MADTDNMDDLNVFFAAARQETAALSPELTARILRDAQQVQPAPGSPAAPAARPRPWRQFLNAMGGWPAMGGLAAACAAGVWIGIAPPDFVPDPLDLVGVSRSEVNLLDGYDISALMAEEQ